MHELLWALPGAVLLGETLRGHAALAGSIRRDHAAPATRPTYPSLSVIRPIRGRDIDAEANLAACLRTGYPGEVETLFVLDDESDPAVPLVRAAIERHRASGAPGRADLILVGTPVPPGRTGKLHAMITALPHARGELIAFGDSDTRPDGEVLRVTVETLLADPKSGAAFAPVAVTGRAQTVGDAGYALLVNALYGPSIALMASRRPLPFIMGQLMIFRRRAIEAIGGLECAEGQLVDDMFLGRKIHEAGFTNHIAPHMLPIIVEKLPLASFKENVRRWMLQSRTGLPSSFVRPLWLRGVAFYLALIATVACLALGHFAGAATAGAAAVAMGASLNALQRRFGGGHLGVRFGWLAYVLFLLAPLLFLGAQKRGEVKWRGRAYPVSRQRRLAFTPATTTA